MDQVFKPCSKDLSGNQNSVEKEYQEKRFKLDKQSLLPSKLEFSSPELESSKSVKTMNQMCDNLSEIQSSGVDKNILSSDWGDIYKPYLMTTVKEISVVKSVEKWTNTNVKVCGSVKDDCELKTYYLESVDEDNGPFRVTLNLECLTRIPPLDITLQIFAGLFIESNKPILRIMFYRDFTNVDLSLFREVEEKMNRYIPVLMNRYYNKKNISESDTSSSFTSIRDASEALRNCNVSSNENIPENDLSNITTSFCIVNDTLDEYNLVIYSSDF